MFSESCRQVRGSSGMEVNSSLSSQLKCHGQSRRGRGLAVNRQEGIDMSPYL